MSVTGRTPKDVQTALRTALVGNTIATTNLGTLYLNAAEDDTQPAVGAAMWGDSTNTDASVVIVYKGGRTIAIASVPQATGGCVQRRWSHRLLVSVSYPVMGIRGELLATNTLEVLLGLVNLIEAGLEPTSGGTYDIGDLEADEPRRLDTQPDYYQQDILVDVHCWWARA